MDIDRITEVAVYLAKSGGLTNAERSAVIIKRWPDITNAEFSEARAVAMSAMMEEIADINARIAEIEAGAERRRMETA